jgi:hypothetical protein
MFVVFLAVFAVLALRPLPKVKAEHHGCSQATLNGNYGLVGSGFYTVEAGPPAVIVPATLSMLVTFDGKGDVSGSNLYTVVAGSPVAVNATFSGGDYTILSDCSVTVTIPSLFGATVTAYGTIVDTGGDELGGQLLSSLTNVTATFDAKRVAAGKWGYFD